MRILEVAQAYAPYWTRGGTTTKVQGISRALTQRGHEVKVLTANLGSPLMDEGGAVPVWSPKATYLPTWFSYRATTLNPGVVSFCKQHLRDFDMVHINGFYDFIGPAVSAFCRRWHIPYVLELMGMYVPVVRSLVKKRLYHRFLGQAHVAGAERLVATSDLEYQQLLRAGLPADKLVLRRNGLNLDEFANLPAKGSFRNKFNLSRDAPLVLFLGRLSRIKSLDLLLRAFATLSSESHLALVGPDDKDGCVEECRDLARRLGVDDRVRWVGPLDGVRKLSAYVDADVFVLPSLSENFGYVAVEAAVCGTAVVLTDRCGAAPLLDGKAAIVIPHEEKALASAIQRLLEDDVLRKRLGDGGRAMLRQVSWEEPAAQMEGLYREILMKRATQPEGDRCLSSD